MWRSRRSRHSPPASCSCPPRCAVRTASGSRSPETRTHSLQWGKARYVVTRAYQLTGITHTSTHTHTYTHTIQGSGLTDTRTHASCTHKLTHTHLVHPRFAGVRTRTHTRTLHTHTLSPDSQTYAYTNAHTACVHTSRHTHIHTHTHTLRPDSQAHVCVSLSQTEWLTAALQSRRALQLLCTVRSTHSVSDADA